MEDLLKVFLNDADLFSCLFCLLLTKALARFTASVFFSRYYITEQAWKKKCRLVAF